MPLPHAVSRAADLHPDWRPQDIATQLGYSSFVNFTKRYLFYEVPKSACTSMKTLIHQLEGLPAIEPLIGGMRETRRDMFIHDRGRFGMKSLLEFDDKTQEFILDDPSFFRFTVVRNPYSRLASAWMDKIVGCSPGYERYHMQLNGRLPIPGDPPVTISLDRFVEAISKEDLSRTDHHWRLQTKHLFHPALNLSHIGRVEALKRTIDAFLSHLGVTEPASTERSNQSSGVAVYDDGLARRVYELYKPDFAAFGYEPDSWRPREASDGQELATTTRLIEETRERNIVIGALYQQRERLAASLRVEPAAVLEQYRDLSFSDLFRRYIAPVEGWLAEDEAAVLYNAAHNVADACIVEIGSYRGRSTITLAFGALAGRGAHLFAVEPHAPFIGVNGGQFGPIDRGYFMQRLLDLKLYHTVSLINLTSEALTGTWPHPVGLLWVDGDHRYEAVLRDFECWRPRLAPNAAVILDDAVVPGAGPARLAGELIASRRFRHERTVGKVVALRYLQL